MAPYRNSSINQMEYLSGIATTIGCADLQSERARDEDTGNSEKFSSRYISRREHMPYMLVRSRTELCTVFM